MNEQTEIEAMQEYVDELRRMQSLEVERLLILNDELRAQLLQAPDAKMVAFVAEFELWLDIENKKHHNDYLNELNPAATASSVAYERCLFIYRQLKAQHLDSTETEAD